MNKTAVFEKTYTRYPFAPLVDLGLTIAAWLSAVEKSAGKSPRSGSHTGAGGGALGQAG